MRGDWRKTCRVQSFETAVDLGHRWSTAFYDGLNLTTDVYELIATQMRGLQAIKFRYRIVGRRI